MMITVMITTSQEPVKNSS